MMKFVVFLLLLVRAHALITEEGLKKIQAEINMNESYHKFTHGRYDQMVTANELALRGYVNGENIVYVTILMYTFTQAF